MSDIAVIIPTSPIPVHPSTSIIEQVIESIQKQLPFSKIFVIADGIRPEVEHRKEAYLKYCENLLHLVKHKYQNVGFFMSAKHIHQAGILKLVLPIITTPLIFFSEHDCTLDDKPIDWKAIRHLLLETKAANIVRLYWHEQIHPEHLFLMLERDGDFVRTIQYSGWPHIARTDFYRGLLAEFFAEDDRKMLETTLYSPFVESPWEKYKTWIFAPEPDAIRFHHLDARRDHITGDKDLGNW